MKLFNVVIWLLLLAEVSKAQDIEIFCYYQKKEAKLHAVALNEDFSSRFQADFKEAEYIISEKAFYFAFTRCDQKVAKLGVFVGIKGQDLNDSSLDHKELKVDSTNVSFKPGAMHVHSAQDQKKYLEQIELDLLRIIHHQDESKILSSEFNPNTVLTLKHKDCDTIEGKKMRFSGVVKLCAVSMSKQVCSGLGPLATWWFRAPLLVKSTRVAFPFFYQMVHGYVPSMTDPTYYLYYKPALHHACQFAYDHANQILPVIYVISYLFYVGLYNTYQGAKIGTRTTYKHATACYDLSSKVVKGACKKVSECKECIDDVFTGESRVLESQKSILTGLLSK